MRWPLRNQIFIRLFVMLIVTIATITYINIRKTVVENQRREMERVERIGNVIASTRFPLTDPVLESISQLSTAEFVVTDRSGKVVSSTRDAPPVPSGDSASANGLNEVSRPAAISIEGRGFVYSKLPTLKAPNLISRQPLVVHVFVEQEPKWNTVWRVSKSPLAVAAIVLPFALLVSFALASQVTKPLDQLRAQVHQIAAGNLQPVEPTQRNDEISELNQSVNEMVGKLEEQDRQARENERLETLVKIGSGLAHNLRNSATGCRLAIEHLVSEEPTVADSENIVVARRQLELMENYIQKFMSLSESRGDDVAAEAKIVDLAEMSGHVVFLLKPSARHLNVDLIVDKPDHPVEFEMHEEDAEQMMINLVSNAISAASEKAAEDHQRGEVQITLTMGEDGVIEFHVVDDGAGPPANIAEHLFKPFVTGKPEGAGLGLSLVQEIADRTGGDIHWERRQDRTRFSFCFPGKGMSE